MLKKTLYDEKPPNNNTSHQLKIQVDRKCKETTKGS